MKSTIISMSLFLSLVLFSGCGDSKSVVKPITGTTNIKKDNNKQDDQNKKTDKPVVAKQNYCVPVTNIGTVSGAVVVSETGAKAREVNGEYCFDEKPQTVKIASIGGVDSALGVNVKCDSAKLNFIEDEALECNSKIPDLDYENNLFVTKQRAIMFRSYLGDIYEVMGASYDSYDPVILQAISTESLPAIKKTLDDANITGSKNSEKKEEIVNLMVDLIASPINRDVITLAMLTLKSTAQIQDGNLTNGDSNTTKWISDNRDVIEEYMRPHDENITIDVRKLVTKIVKLQRLQKLPTPITLLELETLIDPKTVMKFSSDTNIVRAPQTDIITLKGSFDNSGISLKDISFMNKIDGVSKYYKEDNEANEVELFTLFEDYIHFKDDINASLDKFTLIKDYLKDIFTVNLQLDYNRSKEIPANGKDLLATAILDFPCEDGCTDKTEYLTLTFPIHVEEDIDGQLSFVVLADKNVTLTSKIWDGNSSNPSFNKSVINVVNYQSNQILENGMLNIDIVDYIQRASQKSDIDLSKSIKDLLVRHVSNANDREPTPMTQYLSLVDISDPATIPTSFVKNEGVIDPSKYDLDKAGSFYKDIFTEMYQNEKSVNAIAVKTCFSCQN